MQPEDRDMAAIWDIHTAAENIREFITGMQAEDFFSDKKTSFAVISQIEIIGEATKRLSDNFRQKHSTIPWREMAGMRDIPIHAYDEVDLKRVWETANVAVPFVRDYLANLLPQSEA